MLPCLSQVCSLPSPFWKDVQDYAAGHCSAMEVWFTKLEEYLKSHSIDDVKRLCDQQELSLPVASFQGGLLASQGDARREHWALFTQRLELCRALGIGTIIVAGDLFGPLDQQLLERTQVSLVQAAQEAGQRGLKIALEFQGKAAFANNLQTAAALVAEVGSPHLGLCFDAFHYYIGPSKFEDLGYLTSANLFHVQLCDLADTARELATDSDRILPGDGDFQLEPIVEHLRRINYAGAVSVEILNPQIWQIPPLQFGEIAITALRKVLGLAEMG